MKVASMSAPARREIWLIIGMFRSTDPILFFIETSQLCALFESETARPLEPAPLAIGNYFHNVDSRLVNCSNTPMVAPQIIAYLDPVNPSCPTNQRVDATVPGKSADHFECFDIEPLEELPNPRLVRLHLLAALGRGGNINFYWRLERAAKPGRGVSKGLIRLKFRQWLYCPLRASPDFIHKSLQIRKVPSSTSADNREYE